MQIRREENPERVEEKEKIRVRAKERASGLKVGQPPIPKGLPSAKTTTCQEDAKANVAGHITAQS
jgi:hypothetical protein